MKALSWKQPYADLMLYGKIETRRRYTNVRGVVLICATKKPYSLIDELNISGKEQFDRITDRFKMGKTSPLLSPLLNGNAIAVGELVDCRPMNPEDEDKCFVMYHPDLFCWVFENVKKIQPFPFKGSQGWKNVPQEIIDKIEYT